MGYMHLAQFCGHQVDSLRKLTKQTFFYWKFWTVFFWLLSADQYDQYMGRPYRVLPFSHLKRSASIGRYPRSIFSTKLCFPSVTSRKSFSSWSSRNASDIFVSNSFHFRQNFSWSSEAIFSEYAEGKLSQNTQ